MASSPRVIRVRRVAAEARTATAWAMVEVTSGRHSGRDRGLLKTCGGSRAPMPRTGRPANPSASTRRSISPADSNKWRPGDGMNSSRGLRCRGSPPASANSDYFGVSRRASAMLEWHCVPIDPQYIN